MAITTTCPGCTAIFRLPMELAGKSVRCQKCARLFVVPLPTIGEGLPILIVEPDVPVESAPLPEPEPAVEEPRAEATPVEPLVEATPSEAAVPIAPPEKAKPMAQRPPNPLLTAAVVGLFAFGFVATGAFAAIWVALHLAPPASVMLVPPLKEIVIKMPPVPIAKDRFKMPDDRFKFPKDALKKVGVGQAIPPVQVPFHPKRLIRYLVQWDENGCYEETHAMTENDPVEPAAVGRGPYKEYIVTLTRGRNYRIVMASKRFAPMLSLYEGKNEIAHSTGAASASIDFNPNQTGSYRIRAIATHPFDRGAYSLKITELP